MYFDRLIYIIISFICAVVYVLIGHSCYKQKKWNGKYLAYAIWGAAIVNVAYIFRLFFDEESMYLGMSIANSIQYIAIDILLVFAYRFIFEFTRRGKKEYREEKFSWLLHYVVIDTVILMINPFYEIAATYKHIDEQIIDQWSIIGKPLYDIHLAFCYIIIIAICVRLVMKSKNSASVYKRRCTDIIWGFAVIVILNALYLAFKDIIKVDVSLLCYSFLAAFFYYDVYKFSSGALLVKTRQAILDEMSNAMVFFDNDDHVSLINKAAEAIIDKGKAFELEYHLEDFIKDCEFDPNLFKEQKDKSFRWLQVQHGEEVAYRCDYKVIEDNKGKLIGNLFIFAEELTDVDLLTGFNARSIAKRYLGRSDLGYEYPISISICDLNRLTEINERHGKQVGDKAIRILADLMRKYMPKDAYFARLNEANLLVVAPKTDVKQMRGYISQMRFDILGNESLGIKLDFGSATSEATEANPDILGAIYTAQASMKERKMMDNRSSHSSLLASLAQTQTENDPGTEAHVQRTKTMGEKLGLRIGLTDIQLSHLSLLCLLHDIGKLGVPLEILNKPGKLNDDEWKIMRSHVEKGYQICKASKELEDIADLVKHHHECWDGRGYPDRLAGEDIPILSRMISIVDTYDAMTNDRPYRKALSKIAARNELKRCAGTQFDPNIVAEFLAMLEELDPITKSDMYEHGEYEVGKKAPMGILELNDEILKDDEGNSIVRGITYCKYVIDNKMNILSVDDNFESFTGYSKESVMKGQLSQMDLIMPDDREAYSALSQFLIKKNQEAFIEHRLRRFDGSSIKVFCYGRDYFDSVTREPRAEIVITEI